MIRLLVVIFARALFSTLTLITDNELRGGLEKMRKALIHDFKSGPIVRTREKTILVAQPSQMLLESVMETD